MNKNIFDLGFGYSHIHGNLHEWENGFQIAYYVNKIFDNEKSPNISEIPFLFSDGINIEEKYLIELKSQKKEISDDGLEGILKPLANLISKNFSNDSVDIKVVTKNNLNRESEIIDIESIKFNVNFEYFINDPSEKLRIENLEIKKEFIKTIFKVFAVEFILYLKQKRFKENNYDFFVEAQEFLIKNKDIISVESIKKMMKLSKNAESRKRKINHVFKKVFYDLDIDRDKKDVQAVLYYSIEGIVKYASKNIDNKILLNRIVTTSYKIYKQDNESEKNIINLNNKIIDTIVARAINIKRTYREKK